jgi:hypothetical protein
VIRQERDDPPHAQLRGLLHDQVHALPGEDRARERDVDRRLGRAAHPLVRDARPPLASYSFTLARK